MLKNGQRWTLPAQLPLGQVKTGPGGKGLLQTHLWYPNKFARLWDRTEQKNKPPCSNQYCMNKSTYQNSICFYGE